MAYSSDPALQSNQISISIDYPPPTDRNFLSTLSLDRKRIADSVNSKIGGLYDLREVANYRRFFSIGEPYKYRNSYRTTFDLVELNGGPIPAGATTVSLTSSTTPPLIDGVLIPVIGYGAGIIAGPTYVFNGTDFNIRFDNTNPAAQDILITNNTGTDITSLIWIFEYLKN